MTKRGRQVATPLRAGRVASAVTERIAPEPLAPLLKAVAGGGAPAEAAMQELHDRTVGSLMALASGILRSKTDAEEIVCDTYVQVWQTATRFDATRAAPMGWLAMICRSRAIDRLRAHKLQRKIATGISAIPTDCVDEGPERLMSMLQANSGVHAALERLPADRRRLVELAFLEGLSHAALSERMQIPLGTVKSALRRSLQMLHSSLEGVLE
jgi:RNA polymerase sigma-70 factor, ECF subfamily